MYTNDRTIADLMKAIDTGAIQLPDFQRGWVWGDDRIKALIASVARNFPVGAAMFLEYGNNDIRFKYRPIEGVSAAGRVPEELILDGQQRLTSLYASLCSSEPVNTTTSRGEKVSRYYYINIEKALDTKEDMEEAILSVPENRMVTSNFGRNIDIDVSSPEKEYKEKLFPLNIVLDFIKTSNWQNRYYEHFKYDQNIIRQFTEFSQAVIMKIVQYKMPVIKLEKDISKEAVCRVFENVNTGGVSLTVFELVTASFAADNFELRRDWDERKEKFFNGELLKILTPTDFLQACTLLSTYTKTEGKTASCKRKDMLSLELSEFKKYAGKLTDSFRMAEKILQEERIFSSRDMPYTTQLIPLAVLCALLAEGNQIKTTNVKEKIKKWYWCGVFGELYGSANETRYVNDVVDVMKWIGDGSDTPKTVQDSHFNPPRLLSLQSRQSAAYKGIMALIYKNHCKDFISGEEMDFTLYNSEKIDIHHIFPRDYCIKQGYKGELWNSVVNKTPITDSTNREIGGVAPSLYLANIERKGKVAPDVLDGYIATHWIDVERLRNNDFYNHIRSRAGALLKAIEDVTGKTISGKDSQETQDAFGGSLA